MRRQPYGAPAYGPPVGMMAANEWQFQIPQMPILGPQSFQRTLANLLKAIEGEATAAEFYSRLLQQAPNELHRDFIQHAYEDEREHLDAFSRLYRFYTGQEPRYAVRPVEYGTYKEGLLRALRDELEAAEFYRDVMMSTTDLLARDIFHYAMIDELEHGTQFSTLYHTV